jgi:Brp/Blh family beta-carotene 15,15'-monooxygenase
VRSIGAVVAVYLVLGSTDLLVWALAPAAGFVFFIALTWFHWGQGDLYVDAALDRGGGRGWRVAHVVVRGGIPMLLPLVAQPAGFAAVAEATTAPFAPHAGGLAPLLGLPAVRLAAAAVLVIAVLAERLLAPRDDPRAWWRQAGETALLVAWFAVVPPVLAVGLYFCLWHALRHIVRLQLLDPAAAAAIGRGRIAPALARFARAAAPLTAAALALLVALALLLPHRDGPAGLLGVYLVLISALTVPHVAVVLLMDVRQRVWAPPAADRASRSLRTARQ